VLLFVMMFAGALIRQYFVQRHGFRLGRAQNPWPFAAVGVVLILAVIFALRPASTEGSASAQAQAPVSAAQVQAVLNERCSSCHGAQVQMKNIRLDTVDALKLQAQNVYQQAVVTRQMPLNNATQITEEERQLIGRWFKEGAKVE
jgi:uncharacterized membrane protein